MTGLLQIATDSLSTTSVNPVNGFWSWLSSDAAAGWVVAFLTAAAFVVSVKRRKRPGRIVIRDVERSSLVRVRSSVLSRISVEFDGHPVANLGQLDFLLSNDGSTVIREARITVEFPSSTSVLEAAQLPDDSDVRIECTLAASDVSVRIPYLNPYRDHSHAIRMSLIVDGVDQEATIRGSGEGWSVRHLKLPSRAEFQHRGRNLALSLIGLSFVIPVYGWGLNRYFGYGWDEMSWRVWAAFAPLFLLLGVIIVRLVRFTRGLSRVIG